jgi:serine protease Do
MWNGEVIGINSQIYSRTGGYMGVSFAIPIEVAMKVKDDLQKFGKVSRGRLGVAVQSINKELADSFGMKEAHGALVNGVESDSPAAKAGIATGDVILAVNDRAVDEPADLVRAIGDVRPGQASSLKYGAKVPHATSTQASLKQLRKNGGCRRRMQPVGQSLRGAPR